MHMIVALAGRELRAMFFSPLAWAVLAIVQFLLAAQFFKLLGDFIDNQGSPAAGQVVGGLTEAVAAPLIGYAGVILLFASPMITGRALAEERRYGTLNLLYSAPVSRTEIVLGKFLGILIFLFLMASLALIMPLTLIAFTNLDMGTFLASALGLLLLVAAFAAFGLFISSLTSHAMLAGVLTFGLLLWLWLVEWTSRATGPVGDVVAYVSLGHHYVALLKGMFASSDVIYYVLFTLFFLVLTIWRLDADRTQK